jgi:STE24 endopeptidase
MFCSATVAFTIFIFLVEFYLDIRQLKTFKKGGKLPKELSSHVSDETFNKSVAYGKDKFSFKIKESVFSFFQGLLFLAAGYLPYLWDYATYLRISYPLTTSTAYSPLFSEIVTTWFFIVLMTIVDTVISLPFGLYSTFVVEEKHGFNKSTLGLFFKDKVMSVGLTFLLGLPILSVLIWLIRVGGPRFYLYVWVFLLFVSVIMMTIYPVYIAPLFNKYEPLPEGPVRTAIEDLAKTVDFPLTKLFTVDGSRRSSHSNAYFYGFFKVVACNVLCVVDHQFPFSCRGMSPMSIMYLN